MWQRYRFCACTLLCRGMFPFCTATKPLHGVLLFGQAIIYVHFRSIVFIKDILSTIMEQSPTYTLESSLFTPAVILTLKEHYPSLEYSMDNHSSAVALSAQNLTKQEQQALWLDIRFFLQNPHLPLENLCSHLDNYIPRNDSQKELLFYAQKLANLEQDNKGAGLFIFGDAGIGKSHVAIGISKQFMARGLHPQFLVAEKYTFNMHIELQPAQVWIIDDMNSGFHISSRLMKQVVLNAHERGGRVFITSNKDYGDLMNELFVGDSTANKMRYTDRTKGMFKLLHVTGSSYRQEHAWYR